MSVPIAKAEVKYWKFWNNRWQELAAHHKLILQIKSQFWTDGVMSCYLYSRQLSEVTKIWYSKKNGNSNGHNVTHPLRDGMCVLIVLQQNQSTT